MQLSIRDWLALKPETRQAIAKIFRLNRSSFTHVVDNHVESDGYTYQDLSVITVEEMKALTHLESDNFEDQFKLIVKMVEGEGKIIKPDEIPVEKNATNGNATTDSGGKSGSEKKAPTGKK
jgi:hypothetical protein